MTEITTALTYASPLIALTAALIWRNRYLTARLDALRDSAFITNAKGHRVRYVNATPDEQARAETPSN